MENRNVLHTEYVSSPQKSYYLDLKESKKGSNYLVITQSRKVDKEQQERTSLILFEQELQQFAEAFSKMCIRFNMLSESPKNAFAKWKKEEDEKLKALLDQGYPIEDLAQVLERSENGITERLKKIAADTQSA